MATDNNLEKASNGYEIKYAKNLEEAMSYCLELRNNGFWSFRGQRNEKWQLGLHRAEDKESMSEYREQFKKRCNELERPPFYESEYEEWRWLFFAQHHRLKTRLLDWTSNPLVAIYFATENILSKGSDKTDIGAVWAIKVEKAYFRSPKELNRKPVELEEWMMINPSPISARLARQSGKFSYHPRKDSDSIDRIHKGRNIKLKKIILSDGNNSNPSREIRRQLGIMNVHHASMFPDADGIAAFVSYEWKDLQSIENP
jgi:FRG domain